jgi:hypothetical protein
LEQSKSKYLFCATQGEGDGTACAFVNQLWAWLFEKKNFFAQISYFLRNDNGTNCRSPSPCIEISLCATLLPKTILKNLKKMFVTVFNSSPTA